MIKFYLISIQTHSQRWKELDPDNTKSIPGFRAQHNTVPEAAQSNNHK